MKTITVKMVGTAREAYLLLQKSDDKFECQLLKAIDRTLEALRANEQYGAHVPKNLIPNQFLNQGITNLWIADLPGYWRLLYTIRGDKLEIVTFILEWMDHTRYNKLFGY